METTICPISDRHVEWRGQSLLYFGGCDYLRLSRHPKILQSHRDTVEKSGQLSIGASRTTTGNHDVFQTLETELATFLGSEATALTGAGYLANLALASHLEKQASQLIIDASAHSSLKDAAKLSGRPCFAYTHRCPESAAKTIQKLEDPRNSFLLTDGVFGLDGTLAPLETLHTLLPEHIGFIIDDAHGFGVLGQHGKGSGSDIDWGNRNVIRTLSLAKTLGCHGGAIAGRKEMIHDVKTFSPVWSGHTPFPVSVGSACSTSLSLLVSDQAAHQRLQKNMLTFEKFLNETSIDHDTPLPFPVITFVSKRLDDHFKRSDIEQIFVNHGIYPSIIRYPGLSDRSLIKLSISAAHVEKDLQSLASALEQIHAMFGLRRFLFSEV